MGGEEREILGGVGGGIGGKLGFPENSSHLVPGFGAMGGWLWHRSSMSSYGPSLLAMERVVWSKRDFGRHTTTYPYTHLQSATPWPTRPKTQPHHIAISHTRISPTRLTYPSRIPSLEHVPTTPAIAGKQFCSSKGSHLLSRPTNSCFFIALL